MAHELISTLLHDTGCSLHHDRRRFLIKEAVKHSRSSHSFTCIIWRHIVQYKFSTTWEMRIRFPISLPVNFSRRTKINIFIKIFLMNNSTDLSWQRLESEMVSPVFAAIVRFIRSEDIKPTKHCKTVIKLLIPSNFFQCKLT